MSSYCTWTLYIMEAAEHLTGIIGPEDILKKYPDPVKSFKDLLESLKSKSGEVSSPSLKVELIRDGGDNFWRAELHLQCPQKIVIETRARKKNHAQKLASALACDKLKSLVYSDDNNSFLSKRDSLSTVPTRHVNSSTAYGFSINKAKSLVCNIYAVICHHKKSEDYKPAFSTTHYKDTYKEVTWKTMLRVIWPEVIVIEDSGTKKNEAEGRACARLLGVLKAQSAIDGKCKPILLTPLERKEFFRSRVAPTVFRIPEDIYLDMEKFLNEFEHHQHEGYPTNYTGTNEVSFDSRIMKCLSVMKVDTIQDIITGKLLSSFGDGYNAGRSQKLYLQFKTKEHCPALYQTALTEFQRGLPIYREREKIIEMINKNQVVVLEGETGCGKTTQVPQFIFDNFIETVQGATCNIVVTQPRRIAAINIAERVAEERGEKVGESIGYQVRLDKMLPRDRGGVLFCTVGILLRHIQSNSSLVGISHVIVDEVHERDIQSDFLLVLLKEIIKTNKSLKVILMSASINADKFCKYFDGCPKISVPGQMHPVKQYFLREICDMATIPYDSKFNSIKAVPYVVKYIDESRPMGAVLCFLPGWQEIIQVAEALKKVLVKPSLVLPVHSRLSYSEQKKIFEIPPTGSRKIILATNIAETSITVNDVKYVVDSGLQREDRFDPDIGLSVIGTYSISKANMRQRKGRAGRLQPGECFHLYTEEEAELFEEFARPEMIKTALVRVVLDCKLFCPDVPVENLLARAPDPPSLTLISKALEDLRFMGVVDESDELTTLGSCIVNFAMHPQLAKALVYGSLFQCVDPVASMAAILSSPREMFCSTFDKTFTRQVKKQFEKAEISDHISLANIYQEWTRSIRDDPDDVLEFCHHYNINRQALEFIRALKYDFMRYLENACLIKRARDVCENENHRMNSNASNADIVTGVLTTAFYPNILRLLKGEIRQNRIIPSLVFTSLNEKPASITSDSILKKEKPEYCHPWMIYYSAMQMEDRKEMVVYDLSNVSICHIVLFAGQCIELFEDLSCPSKGSENELSMLLNIDGHGLLTFKCSKKDADVLIRWRSCLQSMMESFLKQELGAFSSGTWYKFVEITKRLLREC